MVDCVVEGSSTVTAGAAVDCLTAADFLNQVVIDVCMAFEEDAFVPCGVGVCCKPEFN